MLCYDLSPKFLSSKDLGDKGLVNGMLMSCIFHIALQIEYLIWEILRSSSSYCSHFKIRESPQCTQCGHFWPLLPIDEGH